MRGCAGYHAILAACCVCRPSSPPWQPPFSRPPSPADTRTQKKDPLEDFPLPSQSATDLASGRFLVASRRIQLPPFARTVVLLLEHGSEGSVGLIVNRPMDVELKHVLPDMAELAERSDRAWFGGPVELERMLLLVRAKRGPYDADEIIEGVYASTSLDTLRAVLASSDVRFRGYLGYAGWAPGQLANELARGRLVRRHRRRGHGLLRPVPERLARADRPQRRGPGAPTGRGPGLASKLARFFVLLVLLGVVGCDAGSGPRGAPPHLLLISVDTLRADHLGSYGYERETSPVLDALAARSTRFSRAFAPSPWTLPSHAAMLTGWHPLRAGIRDVKSRIRDDVPVVAEPLRASGYATAAFVDSPAEGFVGGRRGFDRGFDHYAHAPHGDEGERRYDFARTVDAAVAWLESRDLERPFFLFLHSKGVHSLRDDESARVPAASPYDAPEPFRWRFLPSERATHEWRAQGAVGVRYLEGVNRSLARGRRPLPELRRATETELVARYDGAIAYFDHQLGALLQALRRLGLSEGTVVVVTSDHGEGFLEHRLLLHKELHREILHVPLVVHRPPGDPPGRVVSTPVSLEDVAPTLLALAGIPQPAQMQGRPLPFAASDAREPRSLFAYARRAEGEYYEGQSLRRDGWALIRDRLSGEEGFAVRLYDLERDPFEKRPVTGETERRERMTAELLAWYEAGSRSETSEIELDDETLEDLRALGYLE